MTQKELNDLLVNIKTNSPDVVQLVEQMGTSMSNIKTQLDIAYDNFITVDESTIAMKDLAKKYSTLSYPCLIQGNTGTGKELIARILHGNRPMSKFIAINCSALPTTLLESILFGQVAGAFTDAKTKDGLVTAAEDGTLFLDEIGDMPNELQSKLLRVIQNKTYRKLGETKEITTNARFIAATHSTNRIRTDLFYRLSCLLITLKDLKDRTCDIIPIAQAICSKLGITWTEELETKLKENTCNYYNYGNVRELENQIIRLTV